MIQLNHCTDLLSQVYGGAGGETGSLEMSEDGGFMGALGTQLQDILVDWGEDPAEIAALDGQALLAQFLTLAQDRLPPADGPRMAGDQTPASLSATASSPLETPTDLLNKLLESSISGALPATAQGTDALSEMRSENAGQAVSPTAIPADLLRRLLQPTSADGLESANPPPAALATPVESGDTAPATAISADLLRRLLQPAPAGGVALPPTPTALATPVESGDTAPATAISADLLRRLLQPTSAGGLESADPPPAALAHSLESGDAAPPTAIPADRLRRLLQSVPGDGVEKANPATAVALTKPGEFGPPSLPQALPAEALKPWLPSIPADDVAAIPTTAVLADSDESDQTLILRATAPNWLSQFLPGPTDAGIGAMQPGGPLAGEGQGLPAVFSTRGALLDLALKATDETQRLAVRDASDAAAELPETGLPATGAPSVGTPIGSGPARIFDLSDVFRPGGETRLAEQVKWVMRSGLGTAEFTLHPRSLGAMEVRVTMEADQAHVQFLSPHPIVREVLEAALPRLRDALAQDGLSLGNVSISEQAPERRGEADREQAGTAQARQNFDGRLGEDVESPDLAGSTLSVLSGRLDYFI
ncbi:flagellar hook-length control protein FliK [uncultured Thiocystis sp.]|jgi:flagellar hook-length control protein FliK|uniref:flagellar hook-length control protein FliK n=1 Tax=uncultured Thiocystis sp. TaxID=1202134 RepID=UPI0025CF2CB5|nr:flagellar hook-length control protein FliK [uncultured Thiocystis sp.]